MDEETESKKDSDSPVENEEEDIVLSYSGAADRPASKIEVHPELSQDLVERVRRLEVLLSLEEANSRKVQLREWLLALVAIGGLLLGALGYRHASMSIWLGKQVELEETLDSAWDILGGKEGSTSIVEYVRNENELRKAERQIGKAQLIAPRDSRVHAMRGSYLLAARDPAGALEAYQETLRLNPQSTRGIKGLGNAYTELGDLDKAADAFVRACAIAPKDRGAHYSLANTLARQGKRGEAIDIYRKAIAIDPNFPYAYTNLGNELYRNGNYVEALTEFKTAIQLDPKHPDSLNGLASTLQKLGNLDGALGAFDLLVKIHPGMAQFWYNLGNTHYLRGSLEEAIGCYEKAMRLDFKSGKFRNNFGNALFETGQLARAVEVLEEAIRLEPALPDSYHTLGTVYYRQGQIGAAVEVYQKAIDIDPSVPAVVYKDLATALEALGRDAEAREALAHAPRS